MLAVFDQHSSRGNGREIRGSKRAEQNGGDVSMNGDAPDSENEEDDDEASDVEMSNGNFGSSVMGDKPATVVTLGISPDSKWLASADMERKVCVFDLDSLKVLFLSFSFAASTSYLYIVFFFLLSSASHYSPYSNLRTDITYILTHHNFITFTYFIVRFTNKFNFSF